MGYLTFLLYFYFVPAYTDALQHGFLTGNGSLPRTLPHCGDMTSSAMAVSLHCGASVSTNTSMLLDLSASPHCGVSASVSTTTSPEGRGAGALGPGSYLRCSTSPEGFGCPRYSCPEHLRDKAPSPGSYPMPMSGLPPSDRELVNQSDPLTTDPIGTVRGEGVSRAHDVDAYPSWCPSGLADVRISSGYAGTNLPRLRWGS